MLGIIINPKSGKSYFRQQRLYLWKLLKKRHQPFTYRVTKYANHAIELARELVEKGYDEILVLGGDGTLSEVINGIMRADLPEEQRKQVRFGLMPRGTGNDWGRYWDITRDYRRSLRGFFNGKAVPVDVGCLTYYRNGIEHHRYFINSVGFGIDAVTCVKAAHLKYYIGSHHVNYLFGLLWALWSHKPTRMVLTADGKTICGHPLFTMNIGNGPFSGGGMRQNPAADPMDGIFHAVYVEKPTFKQICLAVPRLFNGRLGDLPFIHNYTGKDIQLQTREHLCVEADGIVMDLMGPCEVHCLHHALQMVSPVF